MAVSVALTPGRTIRWQKRRFVVVDSTGFDAITAREVGENHCQSHLMWQLTLLAGLERATGQAGPAAALPQISPMEPITTPFSRAQRRPHEPGSPA